MCVCVGGGGVCFKFARLTPVVVSIRRSTPVTAKDVESCTVSILKYVKLKKTILRVISISKI